MYLRDYFELAFSAIILNKLRTALSIIGIAIGTAAVLTGIILGIGNRETIMQKMGGFGVNNLWFYAKVEEKGIPVGPGSLYFRPLAITRDDIEFIKKECPTVSEVVPYLLTSLLLKYSGGKYYTFKAIGFMLPLSSQRIYKIKLLEGRYLSDLDQKSREKVCVVEKSIFSDEIFGGESPVGKYITVGQSRFKVIGLVDTLIYAFGYPERLNVLFPSSSLQELTGIRDFSAVNVLVKRIPDVPKAIVQVKKALAKRFGQPLKYTLTEFAMYVNTAMEILDTLTLSIIGIAIISLTVGGVGIMNIMSAAVVERTREVGVIKALGARKRTVMVLFLIEAVILSLVGGISGIILSIILAKAIISPMGVPFLLPLWAVGLSFSLSVIIGIASGVYPARRAAELDPVEALRYG